MKKPTPSYPIILLLTSIISISFTLSGYGQIQKASSTPYTSKDAGKFIKQWSLLGPISINKDTSVVIDAATQEKFFNDAPYPANTNDQTPITINGDSFQWQSYSASGQLINLDSLYKKDNAIAYAFADISADAAKQAFLAIGSDDGVKVWHNTKLVHKNWTPRGLTPDQDLIAIPLVQGSNKIVIAVQDINGGWGFTARFLDAQGLSDRLINESARGNLDDINLLIDAGADPNKKNSAGISSLNAAKLAGRTDAVKLLTEKGAKDEPMPDAELLMDNLYGGIHKRKTAPAVAVLVSKDGKVLYKKAYGYADISKKEKATVDTKFRIGSITKQFTAAAILKLQEENKVNVTDKLSKYFPDFPRGNEVTLDHLLTHTSGIHSYTGKPDFVEKVIKPVTNDALLNYFKNDPYDFDPGERYQYNNSAYFLLGYIIEKVSGKSYAQYLKDTFFSPLGMKNTGVHTSTLKLTNEAKGHMSNNNQYETALNWDMSWAGGAGALYSTITDLFLWNEALYNGKVLTEKSLTAALTPLKLNNGTTPPNAEYGYGLGLGKYRDLKFTQHGGGLHGFISLLSRYQEENLNVVILTNVSPPDANMNSNTIAEFYLHENMAPQSSVSVKSTENQNLADFEGRYDFGNGMVMIMSVEESGLHAQLSGQPKFPIFSSGPDEFFWKVVDAKIKFKRDASGAVTGGHFTQGPSAIDITKLKEEKVVTVDPSILTKYVGKYDYGNNFIITVTTSNNKLYAQGTNQPALEIHPVSDTEFIAREVSARIVFIQNGDGKVTSLNLDMGGQKKDAPKIE